MRKAVSVRTKVGAAELRLGRRGEQRQPNHQAEGNALPPARTFSDNMESTRCLLPQLLMHASATQFSFPFQLGASPE
eukprot:2484712-Alexandrium_andersonii.AAC.1